MIDLKQFTVTDNTCAQCGKPTGGVVYAENEQRARAGVGVCTACAGASAPDHANEPEKPSPKKGK